MPARMSRGATDSHRPSMRIMQASPAGVRGLNEPLELHASAASLHFEADDRLGFGRHLHRHEPRLKPPCNLNGIPRATIRWRDGTFAHPAMNLICVQAVGQCNASHRDTRLTTGRNHRLLECFAVNAPASAQDPDVHSVHDRKFVDTIFNGLGRREKVCSPDAHLRIRPRTGSSVGTAVKAWSLGQPRLIQCAPQCAPWKDLG